MGYLFLASLYYPDPKGQDTSLDLLTTVSCCDVHTADLNRNSRKSIQFLSCYTVISMTVHNIWNIHKNVLSEKKEKNIENFLIVFTAKGKLNSCPCRSVFAQRLITRECAIKLGKWVKRRTRAK